MMDKRWAKQCVMMMRARWMGVAVLLLLPWSELRALEHDSLNAVKPFVHRLEANFSPGRILHTNPYLRGGNSEFRTMNHAVAYKLSYSFMKPSSDSSATAYRGAYQGVGLAKHQFNSMLGNPLSAYIFQGAPVARLGRGVSLNYEWNLGLAFGWNPYDAETNPQNRVIGSKVTAYLNAELYANIRLTPQIDVNVGGGFAHFSNGNTTIPNNGLNTLNAHLGVAYYLNRPALSDNEERADVKAAPTDYPYGCDFLLFGAWRRRGVDTEQGAYPLPDTYVVAGFNATMLRQVVPHFQAGVSLDGVLDRSANIAVDNKTLFTTHGATPLATYGTDEHPSVSEQMALGLSARVEWVMPYFTIDAGMGHYVVNAKRDFNNWYQVLALKVDLPQRFFLHIGYSLQDFKTPNHLMLGLGYKLRR